MGGSTSYLRLRFGGLSFLLACLIGGLVVVTGRNVVSDTQHQAAAVSSSRLLSASLREIFAEAAAADPPALTPEQRARADALAAAIVPSELSAIRVLAPDGAVLFATGGATETAPPPSSGSLAWRIIDSGGVPLFLTNVGGPGFVAQLTEDVGPINADIAHEQRTALVTTIIAVTLLYIMLQAAFWLVVRGITSDYGRLRRLYAATAMLRSSVDMHDVLTRITRDATNYAQGQFGVVALYDHDNGEMMLRCTFDRATDTVTHHQRAFEEWFMRRCIITNTTIINGAAAAAFHQFYAAVPEEGQLNLLCVPMTLRDRVVGVVAVLREPTRRGNGFAPDAVRQVVDLAAHGVMAVEQAELFAKVRAYAEEVEVSYDATLKALTAALDAKDDITEGHCERVSKLTTHLARSFGVSERALVDIERGALLHDVGKIGVPDAVLKKPAALNEQEWEAIRKHPLLAGVMISKVGFLEGATPILLYHHERFDGTGYPFGLSGDRIPLEARIFSVVDAYDAMTSDRPYRNARGHQEAMIEIADNSGTQFDPAVVTSFVRLMAQQPDLHARTAGRRNLQRHHDDDNPRLAESVA